MKPATMSVAFLLFLLLLVDTSQGIRFEEELIAAFHRITHKEHLNGVEDAVGGVPCKDAELCSGRNRKLMEKAPIKSKSVQSNEKDVGLHSKEVDKKKSRGDMNVETHETYPSVLDIAGMDYSPAKRKPPIHN